MITIIQGNKYLTFDDDDNHNTNTILAVFGIFGVKTDLDNYIYCVSQKLCVIGKNGTYGKLEICLSCISPCKF